MQRLRRLSRRREVRAEAGVLLVDGPVLLGEALDAGLELQQVLVEASADDGDPSHPIAEARRRGVPVATVQDGVLAKVLDLVTPQRVVAVAVRPESSLDDVLADAGDRGRPVVVLVNIQDPGNAGTVVRVAEAAGAAGVVLCDHSVDPWNPKAVRAAAGSSFRVPVVEAADATEVVQRCAEAGIRVVATAGDGGGSPEATDLGSAFALLVGNEAHGLSDELVALALTSVSVPMDGRVESLNAAVAGAAVLFDAARQRRVASSSETVSEPAHVVGHNVPDVPDVPDRRVPDDAGRTDAS
jgi:TrmH family RNA methyltransferase